MVTGFAKEMRVEQKQMRERMDRKFLVSHTSGDLDCVHTMPTHFEKGEKCDGSRI